MLSHCSTNVLTVKHLAAKAVCSHVACRVDSVADLRSLCHLPCGVCGRSSGIPSGVVYQRDPQTSGGREGHPGTQRGAKAAGTSWYGQHPGAQPERETGVHP